MLKAVISFYDTATPRIAVNIGTGEDVKAPRALAALERDGWVIDENVTIAYKAWLAAKRQGDLPTESKFEEWIDTVSDLDVQPSAKQMKQAVALGKMTQEEADRLVKALEVEDEGEAPAPPA